MSNSLSKKYFGYVLDTFIILFPLAGGATAQLLRSNSSIRRQCYSMLVTFVALLSVFNANKIVDGDLIAYLGYYRDLEVITPLVFLERFGSEPVFYILSWIIGYLTGFSDYLFSYTVSFIGYYLLAIGSFRLLNQTVSHQYFAAALFSASICILPVVFSNSLHLIRQFIALGLFLYGLSYMGKYRNIFWALAFFTHVSSIYLILFSLSGKLSRFSQILAIVALTFISVLGAVFRGLTGGTESFQLLYLFRRVSQETFHDMNGLSMIHISFVVFFIISAAISYRSQKPGVKRIVPRAVVQILIILGLIILVLNQVYEFYEPAARLFFYFTVISILALSIWLLRTFNYSSEIASLMFFLILPFWIFLYLGRGTWSYSNIDPIAFLSPLLSNVL